MAKVTEHDLGWRKKPVWGNQKQVESLFPAGRPLENGSAVSGDPELALVAADNILDYCREHILKYYSMQNPAQR